MNVKIISKKRAVFLSVIFTVFIVLGAYCMNDNQPTIYSYTVDAGAPNAYAMIYDFNGNYFTNQRGETILHFFPAGGASSYWAGGSQATVLSERNPMPYAIHVQWFSVVENQFWEGSAILDQKLLNNLPHYQIMNILSREHSDFTRFFDFTVYVAPAGLVTVWVSGGGEKFLVSQFRAHKMTIEPNWDDFYTSSIDSMFKQVKPRDRYIKERIQLGENYINNSLNEKAEYFNTDQPAGKPLTSAPWERLMKKYPWYLSLNSDFFTLRDYRTYYINGELYYTYAGDNQLDKERPIPSNLSFYLQAKQNNNIPERIDLDFDWDEAMQAFEKISLTPPLGEPVNLYIDITTDLTNVCAYLKKGKESIELKKIKPGLKNLYPAGKDKNIPWEEQTKHWK